jgi:hypothetical protein
VNHNLVAAAVFSQPELASVGLTEEQAIALYGLGGIKVHRARFRPMHQALPQRDPKVLLKLIVETTGGKVVGCHMVGDHAAEIIQMAAIAIGMAGPVLAGRRVCLEFDCSRRIHISMDSHQHGVTSARSHLRMETKQDGQPLAGGLGSVTPLVRELCAAVADLGGTLTAAERTWALLRLVVLSGLLMAGAWLFWLLPLGWLALVPLLMAGVAYALLLIATHEMVHGTLLGWPLLEMVLACLISWPMAWPHATYARLHRSGWCWSE